MGSQKRTCPVCGCELGEGCASCPVCGVEIAVSPDKESPAAPVAHGAHRREVQGGSEDRTPLPSATSYSALTEPRQVADPSGAEAVGGAHAGRHAQRARGRHAAEKRPRQRIGGKKLAACIAAAVAAVAVVGIVAALVLGASANDAGLKDRAGAAKGSAASAGASFAVSDPTDEGNLAANLSGRGAVVRAGDYVCIALEDGIYRQPVGGGDLTKVCGVRAASLNYRDGQLCFIEKSAGVGNGGSAIKRCPAEDDAAVNTVYEAPAGTTLSSLTSWKDKLYFVAASGGTCTANQLPMGENQQVKQVTSAQATDMWTFADQGSLIVVTAQDGSWRAQRASLSSSALSLQSWGSGSGKMKTCAVSEGCLCFVLSSGQSSGHATRLTKTGELKELDQVDGAEILTASEDSLIAVTNDSKLTCANAKSGLLYDSISEIDSWLSDKVPSEVSLGLVDGDLYMVGKTSCAVYDPASGNVDESKVGR